MRLKPWLAVAAAAFAARALLATITERHPVFPDYYYNDARMIDGYAWEYARTGNAPLATPNIRTHAALVGLLYRAVGHRPLAAKLVSCGLGALAVVLFGAQAVLLFGPDGWPAAWLLAFWPSHVFFTSQLFKDPWVLALTGGALLLATLALEVDSALAAWAALPLLLGAALFRPYLLTVLALALTVCAAWELVRRPPGKRLAPASLLAAALVSGFLFRRLGPALYEHLLRPPGAPSTTEAMLLTQTSMIPRTIAYDCAGHAGTLIAPFSPRAISRFRAIRQEAERARARASGRDVATQLFPGQRFDTWLDVVLFIPKGAFYAVFMPLPGLYPIDGKLGRLLACMEDVLLLGLAGLALARLRRVRRWTPALALPLTVFLLMAAGSGLFSFDLGGAARHRILYLPLLLCFAAAPRTEPARSRRRPIAPAKLI